MAFVNIMPVIVEGKDAVRITVNKGSMAPYHAKNKKCCAQRHAATRLLAEKDNLTGHILQNFEEVSP